MPDKDTLAEWLYNRYHSGTWEGWDWRDLVQDDKSYWEHEAAAVRRAVARGGFKEESK